MDRPTQSALTDLFATKHERVRAQAEHTIGKSGDNDRSQEGLAKDAAVANNKADSRTEHKF